MTNYKSSGFCNFISLPQIDSSETDQWIHVFTNQPLNVFLVFITSIQLTLYVLIFLDHLKALDLN